MVYNHSTVSAAIGHLSEEIVKTPSKDLNFPVCLDLTYRIKEVMDNESSSIHDIAQVVKTDPLTSSKLIGLANSALFYGASKVKDIESAVNRLGIIKVRNLSTAIAISQFTSSENMEHFSPWQNKSGVIRFVPLSLLSVLRFALPSSTRNKRSTLA